MSLKFIDHFFSIHNFSQILAIFCFTFTTFTFVKIYSHSSNKLKTYSLNNFKRYKMSIPFIKHI